MSEDKHIQAARQELSDGPLSGDCWSDWSKLRALLHARFERSHSMSDLEEIIQTDLGFLRNASVNASQLPVHALRLAYLAVAFDDRGKQRLSMSDNARASFCRRLAIAIIPDSSINLRAVFHSQLASNLLSKADQSGDIDLMEEAYKHANTAMSLNTSRSGAAYAEQLDTLANVLRQRFLLTRNFEDLERSIDLLEEENLQADGKNLGTLHNLSYSLSLRFDSSGKVDDLNRAIELGFRAIEGPGVTLESIVDRSRNVVNFLDSRFKLCRDPSDIERAKNLLKAIVVKVPADNSRFAALAHTLSHLLGLSLEITNSLEDLDAAITIARKGLVPQHAPNKTKIALMNELGLLLSTRHIRLGQEVDGLAALQHFQSALSLAGGTPSRYSIIANMASIYDTFYRQTKEVKYLHKSLDLNQQAMAFTNVRMDLSLWQNAATNCLLLYMSDDSRIGYLSEGIRLINQCLSAAQKWNVDNWCQICLSAGGIYDLKYQRSQEAEDFNSALTLYLETWSSNVAPLQKRLKAINCASNLLIRADRWQEAWSFLQSAVKLIPIYRASSLSQQDQQYVISDLPGLTALACTAGLVQGQITRALEIWEQGRGMIVASSHLAVNDLSRLKPKHEQLYEAFLMLRAAILGTPKGPPTLNTAMLDGSALNRDQTKMDALGSLEKVIQDIRNCTGFHDFLRPFNATSMQNLASDGAIVVLNSSVHSSGSQAHAILVTAKRIQSIELKLSSHRLYEKIGEFHDRSAHKHVSPGSPDGLLNLADENRMLLVGLGILWDEIAKPICDRLGFTPERLDASLQHTPPKVGACRIRWLTSGALSRLPMHAAGLWAEGCTDVLAKRAISSYAASFRVLKYASERSQNIARAELHGLIVSMERPDPDLPYWKKNMFLKSAKRESEGIQQINSKIGWATSVRPSAEKVLEQLPNYPFVHLATHGVSDSKDPSKSHLVLMKEADANSIEVQGPGVLSDNLSVTSIFRCTAANAVLAFLSACSTADVRVDELMDEGLHIVNAFQIAGFPHVIGTLWSASELVCPPFAKKFYELLGRFTDDWPISNDLIAFAAHTAMMALFKDYPHEPLLWACFVHIGP